MNFKVVGTTNGFNFRVISNGQKFYVINETNWNGGVYTRCWRCPNELGHYNEDFDNNDYTIKPIYSQNVDNDDDFEIVDFQVM